MVSVFEDVVIGALAGFSLGTVGYLKARAKEEFSAEKFIPTVGIGVIAGMLYGMGGVSNAASLFSFAGMSTALFDDLFKWYQKAASVR